MQGCALCAIEGNLCPDRMERSMLLGDRPLDVHATVSDLLQRGYLDAASVVADGLSVVDASRRNRVVSVLPADGPAHLVKQGIGQDGGRAVAREASIYDAL